MIVTPSTLTVVFAPGCRFTFTGIPPTLSELTVASPDEPAQVVVEEVCTRPTLITGSPKTPIVASCTEAEAADVPGFSGVTTFAHSVSAEIRPLIRTTHGGPKVPAAAVAIWPVSGTGVIPTRPLDDRPKARPVRYWNFSVAVAEDGW